MRTTPIQNLILLLLVLVPTLKTIGFGPAVEAAVLPLEAPELTADELLLIEEVRSGFEAAGLTIDPAVTVGLYRTPEACKGNMGLYLPNAEPQVRVCWTHEDAGVEHRLRAQALTHELAHAYIDANVSEPLQQAYLEFNGLESWRAGAVAWEDRGTEHAAELVTWAVLDPAVQFIDFADQSCAHWAAAFTLLTELAAPAPLTTECSAQP